MKRAWTWYNSNIAIFRSQKLKKTSQKEEEEEERKNEERKWKKEQESPRPRGDY